MGKIDHNKKHGIDSTTDHNGVSGATENNVTSFDANALPKDSGIAVADLTTLTDGDQSSADALHAHCCLSMLTKGGEDGIGSGKVVYYSGQSGVDPVIKLAKADSANTMPAAGITLEAGDTDDDIWIRVYGTLNSTDTQGTTVKDPLYVSAATAGEWTKTKPIGATNLIQKIATVLNVAASGNIDVSGANRVNDIPNLAENNVWNGDSNGVPQATASPTVTDLTFTDPQGDPFTVMDLSAHQLDAFNELATTEFDVTAATSASVRTVTLNQPESEKMEFILAEKRLQQPTQVDMTKVHTGLNGTDADPNAIYTYIQNDGNDEPELTASNANPNGGAEHVDGVYEIVGSVAGSVSNVYATNNIHAYIKEKLEKILDTLKIKGTSYISGMDITADADTFVTTSGTADHVVDDATIPALELDRITPADNQFTIEDDSAYTTYDDFQIDEYYDGVAVTNGHHVKCRLGAVINNPELTSARYHIIPQAGATTYATPSQAWADLSRMARTTPRADIVKYAFIHIADIVIKNTTGTFTLVANPDTGLYYNDVRGTTGEGGGGGGTASQNLYETFTGDTGSSTAPSSTGSMAIVGGEGIDTAVTTDTVTITAEDASLTNKGIQENATTAEIDTATSDTLTVTPNQLNHSNFGVVRIGVIVVNYDTDVTVLDGLAYLPPIPLSMNGMDLVRAQASVVTAGTTNPTTIDIYNVTQTADMLSGAISIASGATIGTVGTIDTDNDDVATNDILRIDGTSVSATEPKGLSVILEFRKP